MSQATSRTQKRFKEIAELRYIINLCEKTGLCAVCRISPRYLIRDGVFSMTCDRPQCKRAWLLHEPYKCDVCGSLNFERVALTWDDKGRKLFHCGDCKKTYAISRRVIFETMADVESGETPESEEL